MTTRLKSVLGGDDLPLTELCAMRLDGETFPVDACYSSVDEIERPALRAAALAAILPGGAMAAGAIASAESALWIYGLRASPPARHVISYSGSERARRAGSIRLLVREIAVLPGDVVQIGVMAVTGPLRTLLDIARLSPVWTQAEIRMLRSLAEFGKLTGDEIQHRLDAQRNLPYKRLATARIATLALGSARADPVNVVDPVDPAHRVQDPVQVRGVAHLEDEPAQRQAVA
jgi:hypothetical protein